MSPRSGLRRYALPGIVTSTVVIGLAGVVHLKAVRPMLTMFGVSCPIDNTTTEQVNALRASGLAYLRAMKFVPAHPIPGGFVLDTTTPEETRQWAHENRITCEGVKHGHSYPRCYGVEANKLGLAGPFVSELWLSFGPDDHLTDVSTYWRGMSANDITVAWDGARHALRDVSDISMSTMGDASSAVLGTSSLQTAYLQWRFSDYVAVVITSGLPYAGPVVREQYMSSHL